MASDAREVLWIHDPGVLFATTRPGLQSLWPFSPGLTDAEKTNALARVVLLGGLGYSLYTKDTQPLLWAVAFVLADALLADFIHNRKKNSSAHNYKVQPPMNGYSHQTEIPRQQGPNPDMYSQRDRALNPADRVRATRMHAIMHAQRVEEGRQRRFDAYCAPPSHYPHAFQGSIGGQFSAANNPSYYDNYLNNPLAFDFDRAVRSSNNPIEVIPDNVLARMYNQVDDIPFELQTNPLPDPTFMARHPTWCTSSELERPPWQDQGNMRFIR